MTAHVRSAHIKSLIVYVAIVLSLSACAAFKEIGDALSEDPLESALVISKTNLETITAFRAENCTPVKEQGLQKACEYIGLVDSAYTLAHNATVETAHRIREDDDVTEVDIAIESLRSARSVVLIAAEVDSDSKRYSTIYQPCIFAIDLLVYRLSGATK